MYLVSWCGAEFWRFKLDTAALGADVATFATLGHDHTKKKISEPSSHPCQEAGWPGGTGQQQHYASHPKGKKEPSRDLLHSPTTHRL